MDEEAFLEVLRQALSSIREPRFFQSERGYQGALIAALQPLLPTLAVSNAILEQEYQKRLLAHGLRIRPDILLHEPFDPTKHRSRSEGNYAAFELKRRATARQASEDMKSLLSIQRALGYACVVFINVDSEATHIDQAPQQMGGRLFSLAVQLENGIPHIVEQRA